MNGDLESTLKELGPEYRDVVARLRSAREVEPSGTRDFSFPRTEWRRHVGYLVAASLIVALGLSIFMQDAANAPREPYAGAKVYTSPTPRPRRRLRSSSPRSAPTAVGLTTLSLARTPPRFARLTMRG